MQLYQFRRNIFTKLLFSIIFFVFFSLDTFSQVNVSFHRKIAWELKNYGKDQGKSDKVFWFDAAQSSENKLPSFVENLKSDIIPNGIKNIVSSYLSPEEAHFLPGIENITSQYQFKVVSSVHKKEYIHQVQIIPIRYDSKTGLYEKIESFEFDFSANNTSRKVEKKGATAWKSESLLKSGSWVKLGIDKEGLYKITATELIAGGLALSNTPINEVKVYGKPGGMVPESNSIARFDDLEELAIEITDLNSNGIFDLNDFLVFYAEGPHKWDFFPSAKLFKYQKNYFSELSFVFVSFSAGQGKRVNVLNSGLAANYTSSTSDLLFHHEKDEINLVNSGREWFGEEFSRTLTYNYSLSFSNIDNSVPMSLIVQGAARSTNNTSLTASINGVPSITQNYPGIFISYDNQFVCNPITTSANFPATPNINLGLRYNRSGTSDRAFLNYFEIIGRKRNVFTGGQALFFDRFSVENNRITEFEFSIAQAQNLKIWEVSAFNSVSQINYVNKGNGIVGLTLATGDLKKFILFDGTQFNTPVSVSKVENQNLHAIGPQDMIIVTVPDFRHLADQLADFHRSKDGLRVEIVYPYDIYNEFSAGAQDITAIRDFMKMLYDKAGNPSDYPKYLLMFGDASYDYKDRVKNNTNFVPTYQSYNSIDPIYSFNSDDYFGFLDDNEGNWESGGAHSLDLGIGRIPANTYASAEIAINKIFQYKDGSNFGDWRNKVVYVADDEDNNWFVRDCERLTDHIAQNQPNFEINKIYLDAYKQQSLGNKSVYPEVNEDISRLINSGILVWTYIGHGGEDGLANEDIINIPMINSWTNGNRLPLFVTGTCDFSRYDDPAKTPAGEIAVMRAGGGAIASLTTLRIVYADDNSFINDAIVFDNLLDRKADGSYYTLGEIYMNTKINISSGTAKNFGLLGDPALTLNYPENQISTTEINGKTVGVETDTINALSLVTVKGEVLDQSGNKMNDFNGFVYPTVFDKINKFTTLGNDPASVKQEIEQYKTVIYKGKASVNNGEFEFSFFTPLDISYTDGLARISYYAENGAVDAHGIYNNFTIKGTSSSAPQDTLGPQVWLYMNDSTFIYGGITDENPRLFAVVKDEHGINTTGNGIGRDLIAVLDNNTQNPIVLNDFYRARADKYNEGEIIYPLYNINEGEHSLMIRVWDVYNNSATAETKFVVMKRENFVIQNLMNFPNPMKSFTNFAFEHNKTGEAMEITIEIFTQAGALVKTMSTQVENAPARFEDLKWDGTGASGVLPSGIYLYRVTAKTSAGQTSSASARLVLIN